VRGTPRGPSPRLNHVSIHAEDLESSVRFYEDLLGLQRLATPDFGYPVQWLRLGDQQLHIFQRPTAAPALHHLAVDVDDLQGSWLRARDMGIFDRERGATIRRLPDGSAQMYVRDPAGNLVELDHPDAAALDESVVGKLGRVAGVPEAVLYLDR
jgi:catechol 2,3-dioxygenase-like lactoylglutathione lyase family enzyme